MIDDQNLTPLGKFTPEGKLTSGYGNSYLFFVGRDDVHGILLYLLEQEKFGLKMNMFGYDDEELNATIVSMFKTPSIHVQVSLDRTQAGGVHEKKIVAADEAVDPIDFANSFCILESNTSQISHTKGGVLIGQGVYFEGSTNWSNSGEGTGISLKSDVANPKGFKAQNNTLLVSTNQVGLRRFQAQLDVEHNLGIAQNNKRKAKAEK